MCWWWGTEEKDLEDT